MATNKEHDSNASSILNIIDGFRYSQILFTAVDFKLFDQLFDQPLSLEQLSAKLNMPHLLSLERFLNSCIALKLIERHDDQYSNTPMSNRYLVSTSADALTGFVNYCNHTAYFLWTHLGDAIREDGSQWHKKCKSEQQNEFDFQTFYSDKNRETDFISAMYGLGAIAFSSVIASVDDWSQFNIICDVGGGIGNLAITACEINQHLEAIIFDLPQMETHALHYTEKLPATLRKRVRFHGGDFFLENFPQADIYSLGRILHDWTEGQCNHLLSKIFNSLPERNGALLIAERLMDDDKTGPLSTLAQDLSMLILTGGRERTFKEYHQMLKRAGFKEIKCHRTGKNLDAIIAYK